MEQPTLVDKEDQPPAEDVTAAAPTADSPETPSGEEEARATMVIEAVTEPATVSDTADTVVEVAIPVELDEAPASGEWQNGVAAGGAFC